jgi:hypothetical protein
MEDKDLYLKDPVTGEASPAERVANALGVDPLMMFQKKYEEDELEIIELLTRLLNEKPKHKIALKAFLQAMLEE